MEQEVNGELKTGTIVKLHRCIAFFHFKVDFVFNVMLISLPLYTSVRSIFLNSFLHVLCIVSFFGVTHVQHIKSINPCSAVKNHLSLSCLQYFVNFLGIIGIFLSSFRQFLCFTAMQPLKASSAEGKMIQSSNCLFM